MSSQSEFWSKIWKNLFFPRFSYQNHTFLLQSELYIISASYSCTWHWNKPKNVSFFLSIFSHKNGSIKSTKSQKFWDFEIFFCFSLITNMPNDDNFHLEYNLAALVAHQVTFNRLLRGESNLRPPWYTSVKKKLGIRRVKEAQNEWRLLNYCQQRGTKWK